MKAKLLSIAHLVFMAFSVSGAEPPAELLAGLSSDEFKEREVSQKKLFDWAISGKKLAASEIFRLSVASEDPEVRQRCSEILKALSDADYLSEGSGFLGIRMDGEIGKVEGDAEQRAIVRIVGVVAGSPASKAGLAIGDAIVGLDGDVWRQGDASLAFKEAVSAKKPMDEVTLAVVKKGGMLVDLKVTLGRNPDPDGRNGLGNPQLLDEQARARHFREWLKELEVQEP